MKKTLWLIFVLLLVCVFALSACDNGDTPSNNDNGNNQQTTEENGENNSGGENDNSSTPVGCQHAFGSWSTVKQATCKDEGKLVRTCSKCSETEESTISKTDIHTEVVDVAVSATCTVDGKTEGKHCSVCGKTIVAQTVIKAFGHTEVVDHAIDATCNAKGKTEGKHCSICDTVIIKQTDIAIIDHDYQNGACTMCKSIDTVAKQAEIDAENERHEAKLAQIEEYYPSVISGLQERINNLKDAYGITYVYSDSYCYDKISSLTSEISTLQRKIASLSGSTNSSDVVERRRYEAQLTQKQNEQDMYYKCITINGLSDEITYTRAYYSEAISDENATHKANLEAIDIKYACAANGHTVVIDKAIDPTCTVSGRTEGSHCSVCNAILVATQTISATGHSYVAWNTVLNPTCEDAGREERTCSTCGNTEQNVLPSLGHIGGVATCTEAAQCDRCRMLYGLELGHIGGEASCTAQAVCTRCSQGYGQLLEHKGGTPTCTKKAICSSCSTEYGQINSSNHVGITTIRNNTSPSCEENGYTGDEYCDDCNVMLVAGQDIPFTGHNWISSYVYPSDSECEYIHHSCTKCDTTYDSPVEAITAEVICGGMSAYGSLLTSITARIQGTGGYGDYNYSIKIYTNKTCTTQVKEFNGILTDVVTITVDAPNNRTSIAGWVMEITLSDSYNHSQTTKWEFVAYKSGMSSSDLITQIQ